MRPACELARVIERFSPAYIEQYHPNSYSQRVLKAIRLCRTAALGGHIDQCEDESCRHLRISYNSCRNRHCPKCQNTQREAWIGDRKQDLLPVPYFHVVFTVPETLNRIFLQSPWQCYNLLFHAAWDTLAQFFLTKLGAEAGMISILHTWGQNLSFHPHLHCIVPAGGIGIRHQWKQLKVSASGKVYLFPVENLSRVFRGKLMDSLWKLSLVDMNLKKELYRKEWVVNTKEPFAGPDSVIEYLGRYTHKTAISNHRIPGISEKGVTFRWRDYRDNKQKIMTLEGVEFLRRFSQHILKKGFVRIRHFGFLSAIKRPILHEIQQSMGVTPETVRKRKHWKEICRQSPGYDPDICPRCGKATMITIERFLPCRGPPLRYLHQLIHSSQHQNQ